MLLPALECERRKHLLYMCPRRAARARSSRVVGGQVDYGCTAFANEIPSHGARSSLVTEKIVTARELMLHPVTKLSLECPFVKENKVQ